MSTKSPELIDGWIDWHGNHCPVHPDAVVACKTPFGTQITFAKRQAWHEVEAYKMLRDVTDEVKGIL